MHIERSKSKKTRKQVSTTTIEINTIEEVSKSNQTESFENTSPETCRASLDGN